MLSHVWVLSVTLDFLYHFLSNYGYNSKINHVQYIDTWRECVYVSVCVTESDGVYTALLGMHIMRHLTWTPCMRYVSLLPWSYWLMLRFD